MQPNDPYNQPGQSGQYPAGQQPPQGGSYASGGYAPPPNTPYGPAHTGPGTARPGNGKMPGTLVAARVLMFIGGISGLLLGLLFWLGAASIAGDPEAGAELERGLAQAGLQGQISGEEVIGMMGVLGAVPFGYGLISTLLASFMGKRTPAVMWGTVVFQALAGLLLLLAVVTGGILSVVPLAFTIGIIALMLVSGSRAFYSPTPQGHGPQY